MEEHHTNTEITSANKYMNVLLALSDSKFGFAITDFVSKHRWPQNTKFHILYVVEEQSIKRVLGFSPDIAQEIIKQDEIYGSHLVKHAEAAIRKFLPAAEIERCILSGSAKHEILNKAASIGADLIIVGAQGRTGVTSLLLGSVSMAVLTHATCSVLVVRIPANESGNLDMQLATDDLPAQFISYARL